MHLSLIRISEVALGLTRCDWAHQNPMPQEHHGSWPSIVGRQHVPQISLRLNKPKRSRVRHTSDQIFGNGPFAKSVVGHAFSCMVQHHSAASAHVLSLSQLEPITVGDAPTFGWGCIGSQNSHQNIDCPEI